MHFTFQLFLASLAVKAISGQVTSIQTVTLIPVTVSGGSSTSRPFPTTDPFSTEPDEPETTTSTSTSSKTSSSKSTLKTTTSTTSTTSSTSTTSTTSDGGGISYTTCQGRRPCQPTPTTTSKKSTSSASSTTTPRISTSPPPAISCPTLMATATACKTCFLPDCTTTATVTNPCGCPKALATTAINLGCAIRDVCNIIGCKTAYRVALELCV